MGSYLSGDPRFTQAQQHSHPYRVLKPSYPQKANQIDPQTIARGLKSQQQNPELVQLLSASSTKNSPSKDSESKNYKLSAEPLWLADEYNESSPSTSSAPAIVLGGQGVPCPDKHTPNVNDVNNAAASFGIKEEHRYPVREGLFQEITVKNLFPQQSSARSGHISGDSHVNVLPMSNGNDYYVQDFGVDFEQHNIQSNLLSQGYSESIPDSQTTLYTMPPNYATADNPLNPRQLSYLQQDPLYSQRVPENAPHGLIGLVAPSAEGNIRGSPIHNCKCGANCQCVGCAAHPYNESTRHRVQDLVHLLLHPNEDGNYQTGSRPGSQPHSSCDLTYDTTTSDINRMSTTIYPTSISNLSLPTTPTPLGTSAQTSMGNCTSQALIPSTIGESHSFVSSSSDYYTVEFNLGSMESRDGCTDVTGACRCQTGCNCIGCCFHIGHDLVPPLRSPPDSLADLSISSDTNSDGGHRTPPAKSCCQ